LSHKALARAVREFSAGCGEPVNCDHTSVSRWLGGSVPRGNGPRYIAQVLGRRLGRTVSLADIGFSSVEAVSPEVGLEYGPSVDQAADTLQQLWRADLNDVHEITNAPANGAAGVEAALAWLVRGDALSLAPTDNGPRVGMVDVEVVRATTDAFAALDNRYGGGRARKALIQYLRSDMAALLRGRCSEPVGRKLHAAAAEATLLAAWMSYDAGLHGVAQRYFIQALRLAEAADDVLLAGSILDAMSHQATFLGRTSEAANLARAARTGTQGRATATLTAHFYAMEARALARAGDSARTSRALGEAMKVFERRRPGEDPRWITYFDDAELNAEFGHCFRDLGRHNQAVEYAERSLAGAGASARSDFFVSMVLAAGHLGDGDLEEARRIISQALDADVQLESSRCEQYLRQLRRQMAPFVAHTSVRLLDEALRANAMWTASTPGV
jgi:tetratricopeptide (TPR) repeat protein